MFSSINKILSCTSTEQLHTTYGKDSQYTGSDLWPSLQIQCPCQIFSRLSLIPYQHPQVPYWYQLLLAKINHTYHLYVPYTAPLPVFSSNSVPQYLTTPYSETSNYPNSAVRIATGCVRMTSIDHLQEETKILLVQDHLSLISSQYLARVLQPNIV